MDDTISRREFLGTMGTVAAASIALTPLARSLASAQGADAATGSGVAKAASKATILLEPFDYQGVRLAQSRWQAQYQAAREYYFSIPDDDILKGYRTEAGLPAPGNFLGGWARRNSDVVFGQWLQAMARAYRATGDTALRDKAARLVTEWARTLGPGGDCRMSHYAYEKLIGGLVDMERYAGFTEARPLLGAVTDWGIKNLNRDRLCAEPTDLMASGQPHEWYTVAENFYRAFELTGDPKYRDFADVWLYPAYWNKFALSADPLDAYGFHGYSHVNTFSSAAMAYAVSGDEKHFRVIKNAYEWLQNRQCFATGGYGPYERIMASDGALGRTLERGIDTFENPCGTWAGFKLARYLMTLTGEARYGDWIERLLYNGIGSALPIAKDGKTFYYASYHLGSAKKVYYEAAYPCCSGTYFQDVVEFHNLIYWKDSTALYVNLYVPSEVTWKHGEDEIKLAQATKYPESETSVFTFEMKRALPFPLKFRIPLWAQGVTFEINHRAVDVVAKPGSWASIDRTWQSGDRVEMRIPLRLRKSVVDRQHPTRVALVRGPVVLAQEVTTGAIPVPPAEDELERWLQPADSPGEFRIARAAAGADSGVFKPLYTYPEAHAYRVYFDPQFIQPSYDQS